MSVSILFNQKMIIDTTKVDNDKVLLKIQNFLKTFPLFYNLKDKKFKLGK